MDGSSACPFCDFVADEGEYELLLHIEVLHPEGQSPFVATDSPEGALATQPFESSQGADDTKRLPRATRTRGASTSSSGPSSKQRSIEHTSTIQAWRGLFLGHSSRREPDVERRSRHKSKQPQQRRVTVAEENRAAGEGQFNRLGKSELGRFAHEKRMPGWLVALLQDQGQVINDGIMPVLGQLLEQSPSTQYAYVCHPAIQHVSKLRREGGFCGYRNIQMLTSHIIGARLKGVESFGAMFPTIFQIQDLIENAWDMGFNSQGRIETGGIKGTRKYIGTPEAQALFCSLNIGCSVQAFKDKTRGRAKDLLFEAIEQYFQAGITDTSHKVHHTGLPPVYFQHPGHSLTIVGLEKNKDGQTSLLVFDPSYHDSSKVKGLVGKVFKHKAGSVDDALQPYRRGACRLAKFTEFEMLCLTSRAVS